MTGACQGDLPLVVELTIRSEGWRRHFAQIETICDHTLAVAFAALQKGFPSRVEVSVALVDDAAIRVLNHRFRRQDKATNVLAFPALDPHQLERVAQGDVPPGHAPGAAVALGDIALALETVISEAAAQGKEPEAHLRHLLVHGFLHLLGHDHMAPEEAENMERLEVSILAALGLDDPYDERTNSSATIKAMQ